MRSLLLTIMCLLVCCLTASGGTASPSKSQLKAAYLYNFAKFITWPDHAFSSPNAPLVIGVFGRDDFEGNLAELSSKHIQRRPIEIKHVNTITGAQTCHLLYLNVPDPARQASILKGLETRPVITVGEDRQFTSRGGVIQFVMRRGRLSFIINLAAAKKMQIQLDAQLLSLATEVLETVK